MTASTLNRILASRVLRSGIAETTTKRERQRLGWIFLRGGGNRCVSSSAAGSNGSSAMSMRGFASALPEESYEDVDDYSSSSALSSSLLERPRLEDLRRKLRQDGPAESLLSAKNGARRATSKNPSNNLRLPSNEKDAVKSTDEFTREDWLALVDILPEPATPDAALQDRFQRQHTYLRLSLAERCNLRCTYCMPEDGVPLQPASHLLQTEELLHLASFFRTYGVNKFRLTGGEPTLRKDLSDVVRGLKALDPRQIGMTTNGVSLAKKIPDLVEHGLDSLNLSLDTVQPAKFEALTRRPATYLNKVYEALEACYQHMPASQIKINCVLMRDVNTQEVADFIQLGIERFPGIAVRFIEYMPFTDNGWELDKLVPYKEVLQDIDNSHHAWQIGKIPQKDPHDTTQWYKAWTSEDRFVNVGFITSMTRPFCVGCNRLRLSADGQLKVCLFGSTIHDEPKNLPSMPFA